jgi:hypothetical protein|nr:MAG: hypothetical protein TU35_07065 [Thermoproteus sp. AZ2]
MELVAKYSYNAGAVAEYLRRQGYEVEIFFATYDALREICYQLPYYAPLKAFTEALEIAAEAIYGKMPIDILVISKDNMNICLPLIRDLPKLEGPRYEVVRVKYRPELGEYIDVIERILRYRIPHEIKCMLANCGEADAGVGLGKGAGTSARGRAEPRLEQAAAGGEGAASERPADPPAKSAAIAVRDREVSQALKGFLNAWSKWVEVAKDSGDVLRALTALQPPYALRILEAVDRGPRGLVELGLAEGWGIRGKKAQDIIGLLDTGAFSECLGSDEEKLYRILRKYKGEEEARRLARELLGP